MTIANPGLLEFIAPWVARQRWYARKGAAPALEHVASWKMVVDTPRVDVITHLLRDNAGASSALYQVPLSYRVYEVDDCGPLVGNLNDRFIYDAPHDSAYTAGLLSLMTSRSTGATVASPIIGHRAIPDSAAFTPSATSRVLTSEQSNTSIIFDGPTGNGMPVICKLYRSLHNGDNPDVELQLVLAAARSRAVPQPVGYIEAEWDDPSEPRGRARGPLAFAQEFLPSARDAWRVALTAAELDQDFSAQAHSLGMATAHVHRTLAEELPTRKTSQRDIENVVGQMNARLAAAIARVPSLERYASGILEVFSRAARAPWPDNQRVHGDLHLGQVLAIEGREWIFVDFEGEPLRPMIERRRPDSPMRDVAGMLRSFDYAAGSVAMSGGAPHAAGWVASARGGFVSGYSDVSGYDIRAGSALIDAFEIDKALYETVYEAGNRPAWLPIPVAAIDRLAARLMN